MYTETKTLSDMGYELDCTYDDVKDCVFLRLFNKQALPYDTPLDSVPHQDMMDLAMTASIENKTYICNERGVESYLITNKDAERWGVSWDSLYKTGMLNLQQKNRARIETITRHIERPHILSPILENCEQTIQTLDIKPMPKTMHTMFDNSNYGKIAIPHPALHKLMAMGRPETDSRDVPEKDTILFISNRTRNFAAVNMFVGNTLQKVYERFKEPFYILPISVHELICISETHADRNNDDIRETEEDLIDMVEQINDKIMQNENDILSYNIYRYDDEEKIIMMVT